MDDFDGLDAVLKKKAKKTTKKKADLKAEEEQGLFAPVVAAAVEATEVVVSVTHKELSKEAKSEWSARPKSEEELKLEAKLKEDAEAAAAAPASPNKPAQKFVGRGQSGASGKVSKTGEFVVDDSKFISLDELEAQPSTKPESPTTTGSPAVVSGSPTSEGAPAPGPAKWTPKGGAGTGAYKPTAGVSPTSRGAPPLTTKKNVDAPVAAPSAEGAPAAAVSTEAEVTSSGAQKYKPGALRAAAPPPAVSPTSSSSSPAVATTPKPSVYQAPQRSSTKMPTDQPAPTTPATAAPVATTTSNTFKARTGGAGSLPPSQAAPASATAPPASQAAPAKAAYRAPGNR